MSEVDRLSLNLLIMREILQKAHFCFLRFDPGIVGPLAITLAFLVLDQQKPRTKHLRNKYAVSFNTS